MKTSVLTCILIFACPGTSIIAALIPLGTAETFGVLAGTTITNTGSSSVDGHLGVYTGTAITGFLGTNENDGPGIFSGEAYQGDAVAQLAQANALTAYNQLTSFDFIQDLTGQGLGGLTLSPGVYKYTSTAQLTGELTLDGAGLYVFQIGSALTTAANASMVFLNNANPFTDVFWQIGTSATFGADTIFGGTVIAAQSQTLGARTSVEGRILALNGGVTMDNNMIIIPEIPSLWLMTLAGMALILIRISHRHTQH